MTKKMQVLGIDVDCYSVREMMLLLEEYCSTDGLKIVEIVSPGLLLAASENEEMRDFIAQADLAIISDPVIYEVMPGHYEQQAAETQRCDLEAQFLHSLIRKKKTVFWIGSSESEQKVFFEYIAENYSDLNVVGSHFGNIDENNKDSLVNDLNSASADVILLTLSSPLQEKFISENRIRFNSRLCVCVGSSVRTKFPTKLGISKIKELLEQTMFKRKAIKYYSEHKN